MLKGKDEIIQRRLPIVEKNYNLYLDSELKAQLHSLLKSLEDGFSLYPLMPSANEEHILFKLFSKNQYVEKGQRYNDNQLLIVFSLKEDVFFITYDARNKLSGKVQEEYSYNEFDRMKKEIIGFLNTYYNS